MTDQQQRIVDIAKKLYLAGFQACKASLDSQDTTPIIGIEEQSQAEATAAITTMLNEARVDELKRMQYMDAEKGLAENFAWMAYLSDRIAHLTGQQANE